MPAKKKKKTNTLNNKIEKLPSVVQSFVKIKALKISQDYRCQCSVELSSYPEEYLFVI